MTTQEENFGLYLTILRFLAFKITPNLNRIYVDIDSINKKILLTSIYVHTPSDLEFELLDDIVTNSNAHIPDYYVDSITRLTIEFNSREKHDFVAFAVYEE